jgi:AraC-like DNA-binding protein
MENISTPARRALAVANAPEPAELPEPAKRRVSKKVKDAIEALSTGDAKTIKAAAEKVGMARESLSRALDRRHVAELMRTRTIRQLARASARAGAVKEELLESDNAIARDRASTFILGLAGIQPATSPSLNVNIEVKAGYVIDLSDESRAAQRSFGRRCGSGLL